MLGNVRATITDLKLKDGARFKVDLSSANTYYPFGMLMPDRNWSSEWYRYGFQGQEKDDELKGEGNSVNYTYRMDDTRLGRFFTIDPLAPTYPWNSPYAFSENRVIDGAELEGAEWSEKVVQKSDGKTEIQRFVYIQVIDKTSSAVPLEYIQQFKDEFKKKFSEMMSGGDTKDIDYLMKPEWITFTDKEAAFKLELIDEFKGDPSNPEAKTVKVGENADSYSNTIVLKFLDLEGNLKSMKSLQNASLHDMTHPTGLVHIMSEQDEKNTLQQDLIRQDIREDSENNVMYPENHENFDRVVSSGQQKYVSKVIKKSNEKNRTEKKTKSKK
ncbi:MAG: hypothetical protein CVV25_04365 [Ignavibacteriae bacterium HGW-Ignavibacteriae-4]|jgi:RHS repeat-associated protein|nr:MAG: hypothetical protein CVV25_04365 [Ignavibacteriae bacterium HGW-Ignavibacteriae-4]